MANDLATKKAGELAPASGISEQSQIWQSLVELSKDPQIDAQKIVALAKLQTEMVDRSRQEQFNRDKIKAVFEMPRIAKNGAITNKNGGVQSRYSKFEDIHRIVTPILRRHNLIITFNVGSQGQMVTVQPILSHANGHVEKGEAMALPIDTTGSKNGTQGAGSAASYGKRHSLKAMLNIIEDGEDLDGGDPELANDAENAASCGSAAYARWFGERTREEKLALVKGKHEDYKVAAARADKERGE